MSDFIVSKSRLINIKHIESICRAESQELEETRVILTMQSGEKIIVSSDEEDVFQRIMDITKAVEIELS